MKLTLRLKGGPGSGHHGHSGRPGKVGGSAKTLGVYTNVGEYFAAVKETGDFRRRLGLQFFIHPSTGEVLYLANKYQGGHNEIAKNIIDDYDMDYRREIGQSEERYVIDKGYIRCLYNIPSKSMNFEAKPFKTRQLRILQDAIVGLASDVDSVFVEGYREGKFSDENFLLVEHNNFSYEEFMAAEGVRLIHGEPISLKERRFKGGPGSGHHGHSGRPGKLGGSLPGNGRNFGAFGNDEELYKLARQYIRGHWHGEEPADRKPWDIYREAQSAESYKKDYKASEDGLEIHLQGTFTDDGQYIENKRYITADQFNQVYDELQQELAERSRYVKEAVGLPDNYKEFLAGKDYEANLNVWSMSRERLSEEYDAALARGRDIIETLKANGYDVTEFTEYELKSAVYSEYIRQMEEDYGDTNNPSSWLEIVGDGIEKQYEFDIKHKISLGELDVETAHKLGADTSLGSPNDWEELPSVLYHAATNAPAIIASQLKSRRELAMADGLGLGGGADDTISFAASEDVAIGIERSLHEAHLVASGQIKIGDLLQMAKDGAGAKKPYYGAAIGSGSPSTWDRLAEADRMGGNAEWSAEKVAEERWQFYHIAWLNARQYAGEGFENPVFFGTDWRALAKADPDKFATLKYKAKPGTKGQQMGGLTEWRVVGGDTVELEEVMNVYEPDDWYGILGWEKYK